MKLDDFPGCHLTYCTNIHPGETWHEVKVQLETNLPLLKKRICPDRSMGVGLRLSARAAGEILTGGQLVQFRNWLRDEGFYVFTINGFPYGNFHGERVKEQVYAPDWRSEERVAYTSDLITILTDLLPEGMDGGISTSPLTWKHWLASDTEREEAFRTGARHMARIAFHMANVRRDQGRELHLDIEPEPDCLLENSRETIAFFREWLLPEGSTYLGREFGLSTSESEQILLEHIRVCFDTCHFAVEYEEPEEAIRSFRESGIRVGKTQISAALKVKPGSNQSRRREMEERLKSFDEPVYLHQVVERRRDGSTHQYRDLTDALPRFMDEEIEEWRVHFHVPVFTGRFEGDVKGRSDEGSGIVSTREEIVKSMNVLLKETDCRHFEIETYTWEVLPGELKSDLADSIAREFEWTLEMVKTIEP